MKLFKKYLPGLCITIFVLLILTSCEGFGKKLSRHVVGTWTAELNMAPLLYRELANEFGLELGDTFDITDDLEVNVDEVFAKNELLVKVYLNLYEEGEGELTINVDDMADAVGDFIEPFTSGVLSFDTSALVDLLIEYVKDNLNQGEFDSEQFNYIVDDDAKEVIISDATGNTETLHWNGKDQLEFTGEEFFGQTMIFVKS